MLSEIFIIDHLLLIIKIISGIRLIISNYYNLFNIYDKKLFISKSENFLLLYISLLIGFFFNEDFILYKVDHFIHLDIIVATVAIRKIDKNSPKTNKVVKNQTKK